MRTQLAKLGADTRFTFKGQFARYGFKRSVDRGGNEHYAPTILLKDLMVHLDNTWQPVTDHLWFNLTKGFQKLGLLNTEDMVQLDGRVSDYYKGYFTDAKQHDLKLSYPTKIKLLNERDTIPLPTEKNAIIGLIMNLEWDFYTSNNRPIDTYYLQEFKSCSENRRYNYGVTVHSSAPGMNISYSYDYDDYDGYDDYEDDWALDMAAHAERKQQNHNHRVKRGQDWLAKHESLVPTLKQILADNTTGKKRKDELICQLIEPFVEIDVDDSRSARQQVGQVKNDIKIAINDKKKVVNE